MTDDIDAHLLLQTQLTDDVDVHALLLQRRAVPHRVVLQTTATPAAAVEKTARRVRRLVDHRDDLRPTLQRPISEAAA